MEMNPSSVSAGQLSEFIDTGINRISLGIQSLDDKMLEFMGRDHSSSEAISCIEMVMKKVQRHSIDLIWGLPGQTPESWRRELATVIKTFKPVHMSLYQLTVKRGTELFRQVQTKRISLPDLEQMEELGLATEEVI